MCRFILNTMLTLFVLGSTHEVNSQILQKGQQVRVYLNKSLLEHEALVKKVPGNNLWLIKSKTEYMSYDGDTLKVSFQSDQMFVYRDSVSGRWESYRWDVDSAQLAIHQDDIAKIEMRIRKGSNARYGAAIGMIFGGGAGAVLSASRSRGWDAFAVCDIAIGATVGSAVGYLIGSFSKAEIWQEMPLQQLHSDGNISGMLPPILSTK